jgi:hypothetical protein
LSASFHTFDYTIDPEDLPSGKTLKMREEKVFPRARRRVFRAPASKARDRDSAMTIKKPPGCDAERLRYLIHASAAPRGAGKPATARAIANRITRSRLADDGLDLDRGAFGARGDEGAVGFHAA